MSYEISARTDSISRKGICDYFSRYQVNPKFSEDRNFINFLSSYFLEWLDTPKSQRVLSSSANDRVSALYVQTNLDLPGHLKSFRQKVKVLKDGIMEVSVFNKEPIIDVNIYLNYNNNNITAIENICTESKELKASCGVYPLDMRLGYNVRINCKIKIVADLVIFLEKLSGVI